jgi:two-component system, response regulator
MIENIEFILLVEDNSDDVLLMQMAFRKCRISNKLAVASDGEEALEFLFTRGRYADRDHGQNPSLVLLDLKIPYVSGLEVLRQIRRDEKTRSIPVVVLTSSVEETDRQKSLQLGADGFFVKPIDFDEFIGLIRQLSTKWLSLNHILPDCRNDKPAS